MADKKEECGDDPWEECKLNRSSEATKLLRLIENIHAAPRARGHILNIDAKWGEGKTFFLHCWKRQLEKNHLVVYWNAWETDFSKEPLLSLFSLIYDLNVSDNTRVKKALNELKKMLPAAAHVSSKIVYQSSVDELKDATDTLGEKIIKEYEKEYSKLKELKARLGVLVKSIDSSRKNKRLHLPIFILVDELDRCRPDYALLLLERIKHIFDVPGMQFIIATDTEQLSHTVNAVYGAGLDSHRYLKRFFDIQYNFNDFDAKPHANFLFDEKNSNIKKYLYATPWPETHEQVFCDMAKMFDLSMRDRIQIFEKLEYLAMLIFSEGTLHLIPMLYFLCLHHKFELVIFHSVSSWNSLRGVDNELVKFGKPALQTTTKKRYPTLKYTNGGEVGSPVVLNLAEIVGFYLAILKKKIDDLKSYIKSSRSEDYEFHRTIGWNIVDRFDFYMPQLREYPGLVKNMGGLSGWQSYK